ncbi:MAG: two-component sensor histidine kinase BarA [Enterobacteriaceae bacterium]
MTKYSLRARMLILILAPTLLIALLLTTFFVVHRYNQLQEQIISAGSSIIEPLAIASEYGIKYNNREELQRIVWLLHRQHSDIVRAVAIFDVQNHLFATSNYHYNAVQLQLPPNSAIPTKLTLTPRGNTLILRTPIVVDHQFKNAVTPVYQANNYLGYVAIELDMSAVKLQQYKEVFVAILMLLLCLCIAMLFAYRLMRDVTGPIRNMVDTVDRIRRGQLNSRVEGHMLGELDMLKNGINAMAISMNDYHEEMQQYIDQATSDLRETLEQMEIQNVELDLAKKKAQEAARIKSEFLANMSHELRTPLNGVIGFSRQMLKTELNPVQVDYMHTIERSASNLLNIINDVLDFSKLEAGKLLLETIPFSLRESIDEIAILLAHSAHEKGLELILDIRHDVPEFLLGDPLRLQQILTNLLGNAIKFTETGEVTIRVELSSLLPTEAELEIQVHDTGIGISEQQQSKLFQAFRQADASVSRSHGGTGLGLVITQKLVQEMGGDINFYSQPNSGSIFWFQLRVGINSHLSSKIYSDNQLAALAGKTLLYIETNPTAAQATLALLKYTPLIVHHYTSLQQVAPDAHFDILLLSVPASLTDSLTHYCQPLTQRPGLAKRTLLMLPTQLLPDVESQQKLGVEQCLTKPVIEHRLFRALMSMPLSAITPPSHQQDKNMVLLPLKVMAVDDNPANLKLIGALLQEMAGEVVLCHSAEEAIAVAQQQAFDVILMDIQMPKIDGIRAAELIHQLPLHTRTPIVAVTANVAVGERERLLRAGMADYLSKPIDEESLQKILLRYLSPQTAALSLPSAQPATLDWAHAIQRSAHKPELAAELLQMLLQFLPEVSERVRQVLQGKSDESIVDLIHKLHGSCSYCGVPRLQQICNTIEQLLRAGTTADDLEPEWLELLDEIDNVRQSGQEKLKDLGLAIEEKDSGETAHDS